MIAYDTEPINMWKGSWQIITVISYKAPQKKRNEQATRQAQI